MSINPINMASTFGGLTVPGMPGVGGAGGVQPNLGMGGGGGGGGTDAAGFTDMLKEMMTRPSSHGSDKLTTQFAAGANIDPHMIAINSAKAGVEIQMATRVISTAVSGIRTLMQTQI